MSRHSTDIVGYALNADIYCAPCTARMYPYAGVTAEQVLDNAAQWEGVNREDESSFDSSNSGDWGEPNPLVFPKVIFESQRTEGDRCGSCGESLSETITGTDVRPGVEPQD